MIDDPRVTLNPCRGGPSVAVDLHGPRGTPEAKGPSTFFRYVEKGGTRIDLHMQTEPLQFIGRRGSDANG